MKIPKVMKERIVRYCDKLSAMPKLRKMYENCYTSTWLTALQPCEDGTYFVLTGDIPAMWLRDSAAQVTHYIPPVYRGINMRNYDVVGCAGFCAAVAASRLGLRTALIVNYNTPGGILTDINGTRSFQEALWM